MNNPQLEGTKYTFFEEEGILSVDNVFNFLADESGISVIRLREIFQNQSQLNEAEYEELRPVPAGMIPSAVWEKARNKCLEVLNKDTRLVDREQYELFESHRLNRFADVQGAKGVLPNPHKKCIAFIRVRADRLLQSFEALKIFNEQPEVYHFSVKCFRPNFTSVRYAATVLSYLASPEDVRREMEYVMDHGGIEWNVNEWIKYTKPMHEMIKVMRRCMSHKRLLSSLESSRMMYINNLAGRDHFMTGEATLEEVSVRVKVPDRYVGVAGVSDEDNTHSAFARRFVARYKNKLQSTGKVKPVVNWTEYNRVLYQKVPGGSVTLPSKTVGGKPRLSDFGSVDSLKSAENVRLSGNKRLYSEMVEPVNFRTFGVWFVIAFLKYEVAKNRWLYPADYKYTILALYIMDHMKDAFYSISGVDIGHTLEGGIATKLDVIAKVAGKFISINTDGAGFNEEHHYDDMKMFYDLVAASVNCAEDLDNSSVNEHMEAVNKYLEGLLERNVKIPKFSKDALEYKLMVYHTLFSGEGSTQELNTSIIGGLGMEAVDAARIRKLLSYVALFWKGDDLNGFVETVIEAIILKYLLRKVGFKANSAKDHVEVHQCEHERCLVTENGYHGSLFRRIGSLVCAEPQGITNHTLIERIESLNQSRRSMLARGSSLIAADAMFSAGIMTRLKKESIPNKLIEALSQPRNAGGMGMYYVEGVRLCTYRSKKLPVVTVKYKGAEGGKLSEMAWMTDPMLDKIADEHVVSRDSLSRFRDMLIGDSVVAGLGGSKYGDGLSKNDSNIMASVKANKFMADEFIIQTNIWDNLCQNVAKEFGEVLRDPDRLRHRFPSEIREVVARNLATSGCLNVGIYRHVKNVSISSAYISLASNAPSSSENAIVEAFAGMNTLDQLLFAKDEVYVCSLPSDSMISVEMEGLLSRYVRYSMVMNHERLKMNSTRSLNRALELELMAGVMGRKVEVMNRTILNMLSY